MFNTLLVQPIFNVLVAIYALLPGHNFGVAIILFTVLVRFAMWPLVKKQLHHAKAMRQLQPELKKIKQATKGNRQKASQLVMELYKERGINPFSSIGLLLVQLPIFIALYSVITKIIKDPSSLNSFAYPFVQNLPWLKELAADISKFDSSLFGLVDLGRAAFKQNTWYLPALVLVFVSAVTQFYQGRQLMPQDKDAKSLRQILREASEGKQADQSEMAAATGRFTQFMIPGFVFFVTLRFPAALSLYWSANSIVAIFQQGLVLRKDESELEKIANKYQKNTIVEGEIIPSTKNKRSSKKSSKKTKKRR